MTIDIRTLPVSYLNLNTHIDRNKYMIQHLTINNFTGKIHREEAPVAGQIDIYPAFTVGLCKSLLWLYLNCTDEFVIHLDDDIEFEDIDRLNREIEKVCHNDGFLGFFVSYSHMVPTTHTPPVNGDCLGHLMLVKRSRIPELIHCIFMNHLVVHDTDRWQYVSCKDIYIHNGVDCHQMGYYFPSVNRLPGGGLCTRGKLLLCSTDKPLHGNHILNVFNDTVVPTLHMIHVQKHTLIRVFRIVDNNTIDILRPNGIVETVKIPQYICDACEKAGNDNTVYQFIANYDGIRSTPEFHIDIYKYIHKKEAFVMLK